MVAVATETRHFFGGRDDASGYVQDLWLSYLERIAKELRLQTQVPIDVALLTESHVARMIANHAKAAKIDMIVMTTHGRGALGRLWLGSVAVELMQISPVPLLMLGSKKSGDDSPHVAGPREILVPLDGSAVAEEILAPVAEFAQLTGASCRLVRVISDIPRTAPELDLISLSARTPTLIQELHHIQEREIAEARRYLTGIAKHLQSSGLRAETKVIVSADPGAAILEEATQMEDALVALETHGRRGVFDLSLGSVARKIVSGLSGAALVQPAKRNKSLS